MHIASTRVAVESAIDPWQLPLDFDEDDGFRYQYRFGIARLLEDAERHALVWPNGHRKPSDHSEYVAALTPEHHRRLGSPRYVVIENAADPGKYAAALARADANLEAPARTNLLIHRQFAADVVAIDRGVREVIGISDGEFAVVHGWRKRSPGASLRRRAFATRSVYAHPSPPLRGDLEKPVCRLSKDAMASIGAREGDHVSVEALVRTDETFKRRRIKRRALLIDRTEAAARAGWSSADAEEGYIDCAELHGIFPPYPSVYLDYFAQRELFAGRGPRAPLVCPVVEVRPLLLTRFADEASEFTWIGIVAAVAVVARSFDSSLTLLAVLAGVLLFALVYARVRRALR